MGVPTEPHSGRNDEPLPFLAEGGELGALMRAFDWERTPLGAPGKWPHSLKTAVRILLTSRQPMFVWWGTKLINLYNDPYRPSLGGKHPSALGRPAAEVWQEIWDQVGPRVHSTLSNDQGTFDESLLLMMERNGYPEETYYTFSYSPLPDDQGEPCGIFGAVTEDTQRIIGARRLALQRDLAARTVQVRTIPDACASCAAALATNSRDLPFALLYLKQQGAGRAVLMGRAGIAAGHPAAPPDVSFDSSSFWPIAEALRTGKRQIVDLPAALAFPTGAWERPPERAVLLPINASGQIGHSAVLIAALNPHRLYGEPYEAFLGLVAGQIASALIGAQAYEEERQRVEALAELDCAKTAFFSNVSHEFRTPLTLMLGPLQDLLSRGEAANSELHALQLVYRNGLRMQKLVNALLDFSRIEAGRVPANLEPVDLAAFTAELASVFRSAMDRAGLSFRVDCPPLPRPVCVDREMWEKIVLNLLSNALKYTFEGWVAIQLREEAGQVKLSVSDSG
ncbi:MAG: sensor histidine kinase, partial [Bryobacteraceae bacterium]